MIINADKAQNNANSFNTMEFEIDKNYIFSEIERASKEGHYFIQIDLSYRKRAIENMLIALGFSTKINSAAMKYEISWE